MMGYYHNTKNMKICLKIYVFSYKIIINIRYPKPKKILKKI